MLIFYVGYVILVRLYQYLRMWTVAFSLQNGSDKVCILEYPCLFLFFSELLFKSIQVGHDLPPAKFYCLKVIQAHIVC